MIDRITLCLYLLTLSLWMGGAFFLAFVIAPKTFQFFPSRSRAGTLVFNFLKAFDILKIFLILALVAFSSVRSSESLLPAPSLSEAAAIFLMTAGWVGHHFFLAPKMDELRLIIGCFDTAPAEAPERASFTRLHSMAMFMTLGDFAAGLFLLFTAILRLQ
jgi:hypothetical protein